MYRRKLRWLLVVRYRAFDHDLGFVCLSREVDEVIGERWLARGDRRVQLIENRRQCSRKCLKPRLDTARQRLLTSGATLPGACREHTIDGARPACRWAMMSPQVTPGTRGTELTATADHRTTTTSTALSVSNLEVVYNVVVLVLRGVSLSVPTGHMPRIARRGLGRVHSEAPRASNGGLPVAEAGDRTERERPRQRPASRTFGTFRRQDRRFESRRLIHR